MSDAVFDINGAKLYATPYIGNPFGYASYQAIDILIKLKEENEKLHSDLEEAREVIEFYAKGAKSKKYKEFGCGCCASSLDEEGDPDYEESGDEVQGRTAREYLAKRLY